MVLYFLTEPLFLVSYVEKSGNVSCVPIDRKHRREE